MLAAGQPAEAFREIEAALAGPEGDPVRRLPLLLLGVEAAIALGRWDENARWLDDATRRVEALPADHAWRAEFARSIAWSRSRRAQLLGKPDEAARHLAEVRTLSAAIDDPVGAVELGVAEANLWLLAARHDVVEAVVGDVLARVGDDIAPEGRSALLLCLATSCAVRGRTDAAFDGRARELFSSPLDGPPLGYGDRIRVRLRLAEIELRAGDTSRAHELLAEAGAMFAADAERHRDFERGLHAVLRARLRGSPHPEELALLRDAHDRRLAALSRMPLLPDGVGYLQVGEERSLLVELLVQELAIGGGPGAALDRLARVHALATRHRRAGRGAPSSMEPSRLVLAPREGVLVYVTGPHDSLLLLVDARGVTPVRIAPIEKIQTLRRAFLGDGDGRALPASDSPAASALRAALLPDVALETMAGWSALSVVGLDLVRYVPFEALPLPDGATLGERWDVAYQPDLVTIAAPPRREPTHATPPAPCVAWIGAPRLGPEFQRLTLDRAARKSLGAGATTRRVLAASGPDADADAVRRAATSGALVLHILTHGTRTPDSIGTGLALSARGGGTHVLGARDVEALPSVPPIVILSACRAARGVGRLGESGLDGLAGAFLEKGALCVVMPYDDVELSAALVLVERLQPRLLRGGMSVAKALRETRAELAESRGSAPLFHAIGRAHLVLPRAP